MTYTKQGPFSNGGTATSANLTAMDNGIAAAVPLDGSAAMSGQLQVVAPSKLVTGNQESGVCGADYTAAAANGAQGYMVNFKTHLTNVPTSITLTVATSGNVKAGTPTATNIVQDGFLFFLEAASAGTCDWLGAYTTVGNCLLAVDPAARTFDHHCDGCRVVRRGIPIAEAVAHDDGRPARRGLAYHCACGSSEHWTATLTAADEADETPQGEGEYATTRGRQAALIRALMRLVGLSLVDEPPPTPAAEQAIQSRARRRPSARTRKQRH